MENDFFCTFLCVSSRVIFVKGLQSSWGVEVNQKNRMKLQFQFIINFVILWLRRELLLELVLSSQKLLQAAKSNLFCA
jgi:hypothetical protein